MTIPISTNRVQYDGNGAQVNFPYTFRILREEDLVVVYTNPAGVDATWILNTHYSVTDVDEPSGGNVVVKVTYTPPASSRLTIYRELDITQESDYVENAPFHADTLEDDLDKGTMIDQQLAELFDRSLSAPVTDSGTLGDLPSETDRANKYLKFDADGNPTAVDLPADKIEDGTDNHVARYDGTDSIQSSVVVIDDAGIITALGGTSTQWNTAYGWGNHAIVGYATSVELSTASGVLAAALTTHKSSSDHDGRYYTETELNAGQLDTLYYTKTLLNAGQLDTRYYTETEINSMLTGYATDAEVLTISGNIVAQIPTDYISDSEMTVISGNIVAQIPSLAGFATELYVNSVSGSLHAEIENIDLNFISNAEMTVISGDIIAQIPTDYYTQGQIATISGDIVAQIPSLTGYATEVYVNSVSGSLHSEIENIDLTTLSGDLVIGYTSADTTLSGLLHAEIVAASGTTDHSLLTSLDYASSGHTGFQPAGDYVTEAEFTTYSGDIINQIPTDFYTTGQVDAISGALHSEIDDIDLNYISNAEMTVISGDIINQIPSLSGYATELYVDSVSGALNSAKSNVGHTHDDRYYTESEMTVISGDLVNDYVSRVDTVYDNAVSYTNAVVSGVSSTLTSHTSDSTIHFTEASISHSAIDDLENDDHTQYLNNTRGDARYYTQAQSTTQSGNIVSQIITDHGALTGKSGDDHTQYILVNGGRAFTSTIAGITPSADEDLATKFYVDNVVGEGVSVSAGTINAVSGTTTITIGFGAEFPNNDYGLALSMENTTDPNPSIYDFTITEATTSGFTIELTGVIDSDNYFLRYTAIASGTISATDHGTLAGLADDDHAQYLTTGRGDTRYYLKAEVDSISGTINSGKADVVHTHVEADILDLQSYLLNVLEDTTPELGGDLSINGKCLNYGTILTSSGTYSGDYLTATVDDASSVFGSVLYQGTDFHFDRADADATTTSPVFVLALEAGTGSKKLLIRGQVCDTAWNWAAGKLYLSPTIGTMTQTKPSTSGQIIQVLGFALSADTIWFDPVTMVAEVA